MKRLILAALIAAYCLTVQAADPFQMDVDRQHQAKITAAAAKQAAKRKQQLETSAAPDTETAAKLQPRKWRGDWHKVSKDGTIVIGQWKNTAEGKLVRVYRTGTYLGVSSRAIVEMQSSDGTLWRAAIESMQYHRDNDSVAYVRSFIADWEKKH